MPDKKKIDMIVGDQLQDLKKVRIPGLEKPFEKLTISELVQLRPGSDISSSWEVNAVTDNVSATTDSSLAELGRIHKIRSMEKVVHQTRLNDIRNQLAPGGLLQFTGKTPDKLEPESVKLPDPDEDFFSINDDDDPFSAS